MVWALTEASLMAIKGGLMMRIYLCGACNSGKGEICRIVAEKLGLPALIDPSEAIFKPIYSVGLDRVFRGYKWQGKREETYQGLLKYLEAFEEGDFISNEGPLLLLSHLLFFGVLSVLEDSQRKTVLEKALSQLDQGRHYIIERWAPGNIFDQVSVTIQKDLAGARENIKILPAQKGYEETISKAVRGILREVK